MAISPELQQFKSSGVYRLEFDKSQTVNVPQETIRLVVGHSKKGPYNTPVFIENTEQFIDAFGSIDRNLERKGIYFHRSALEALSRGPILAVNLFKSDYTEIEGSEEIAESDLASFASLVTNGSAQGLTATGSTDGFSKFFDTERFWKPTDVKLLDVVKNFYGLNADDQMANRAINFVNIKQDPITVIVRQATDTRGFDVVAREWYGADNVPSGIDPMDYISEYLVEVLVFKGRFDASELNNDPVYGAYFDENGLIKSKMNEFAARREVKVLASYTGSLIPDFVDLEGRQMYIEALVNLESRRTGLFCAVNEDALATIDLVGDSYDIYQDYEVLSHIIEQTVGVDTNGDPEAEEVSIAGGLLDVANDGKTIYIHGGDFTDVIEASSFLLGEGSTPENLEYSNVLSVTFDGGVTTILTSSEPSAQSLQNYGSGAAFTFDADINIVVETGADSELILRGLQNFSAPAVDDFLVFGAGYDSEADIIDGDPYKVLDVQTAANANDGALTDLTITLHKDIAGTLDLQWVEDLVAAEGSSIPALATTSDTLDLYTVALNDRGVLFPTTWNFESVVAGIVTFTKVVDAGDPAPEFGTIKVGQYMSNLANPTGLSKILQISRKVDQGTVDNVNVDIHTVTIVGHRHLEEAPTFALKSFNDATVSYKTFPMAGADIKEKKIADLLEVVVPGSGKGFANALVDKDNITFRYIVDTFGSFEDNAILNKVELTKLAQERQNASAILNAPMIEELRKCTNPSFVDSQNVFQARYIAEGGNVELNPTSIYTLPDVLDGANYGFYYGPGLTVIENGKTLVIPPAAYVSNNYIDKYTTSLPWSIIAGPRRGVVSGRNVQGLEYSFDKLDRDVVEPFGINPIVFERGVGLVIKGNKTGQQKITSALSSAHVREALIFVEDGLAAILQNYLFEFNTAQTRLEIKTLADSFMESVKKDGGVYDYRNIMDTTNNTNEVIDANVGVLDTYVEPVKGLEILVSRVTVLNTGEIESGNFS